MFHYAIAIKAPGLPVPALRGGAWTLVDLSQDVSLLSSRYNALMSLFAGIANAQMLAFSFDDGDNADLRCIGRMRADQMPAMASIGKLGQRDRDEFWQGIEATLEARGLPPIKRPKAAAPTPPKPISRGTRTAFLLVLLLLTAAPVLIVGMEVAQFVHAKLQRANAER